MLHSNLHLYTTRFTPFVSLVKFLKKLHWPTQLNIPGEEPNEWVFVQIRRYTIFSPPDGIYRRIRAKAT